ncbi:SLATT domain-containing protein [Micromonospora sp. WMMD1120]|uniref:SLATT domain-containing protein n=1 Tax=Micromonospora sp. WMMD1120 TaxID=3016106 RepID=UPI00241721C7|nr:SLATT domain-containing protein [Micromonospora sp. WMMD1120]MDG4808081.1 SLATT domain-containing protein [Micromonospora sp. WMMD1120]
MMIVDPKGVAEAESAAMARQGGTDRPMEELSGDSAGHFRGNDQLLLLTHQVRETEHRLAVARGRRSWSNVSMLLGPLLGVILYALYWIPVIPRLALQAVYIPAIPVAIAFCFASYYLKTHAGYPERLPNGEVEYLKEGDLELRLARQRDNRKHFLARTDTDTKVRRIAYKEDAFFDIDRLRLESKGYRRFNNFLQGVLIIGSIAATGAAGLVAEFEFLRWVTLGLTLAVGISSGFMGYYKYKERSFYLQQTADAIENEWEAVEVGVGRYKRFGEDEEGEALAEFVEEVHRLKAEQKKRQQNLEQPPEARNAGE